MNQKILNIKNILKIIISLLFIFSMIKSCARAERVTLDMLPRNSNINKEQALEEILSHYGYLYGLNNSLSNNQKTNWENYKRNWQNASYSMIYIWLNGNAGTNYQNVSQMYYVNNKSDNNLSPSTSIQSNSFHYKNARSGMIYKNRPNDSLFDYNTSTGNIPYQNSTFYYILVQDNEGDWYEYSNDGFEILEHLIPPFEFQPAGEEVTINSLEVNAIKLNNMVIPFNLGQIIDLENYYNVMVSLIDSSNNNVLDIYSTKSGVGNGLLQKSGNGYILASSARLYYKHIYKLSLDVFRESNTSENYEYYYIFLPNNAVISSGTITKYGSGDFSNQDIAISNEQNTQNNNNLMQELYNNLFTMESGEVAEVIQDIRTNTHIDNIGIMSGELAILNTITGEPHDFIIAWNRCYIFRRKNNTKWRNKF